MNAILVLLALCAVARADDTTDAETAVRAHLDGVVAHKITKLTPDARLFSIHGKRVATFAEVGPLAGKVTKLHVGIPGFHAGWFHAELAGGKRTFRVVGLLIHEPDVGWKVEVEMFTEVIADPARHLVPIAPQDQLPTSREAKQIAQVLPGNIRTWLSHDGVLSGATPAEYADTPEAIDKLAERWDQLPITWKSFDSVAPGAMILVHGEVRLEHEGKAVPMTIALIGKQFANQDKYTWLAIAFGAP